MIILLLEIIIFIQKKTQFITLAPLIVAPLESEAVQLEGSIVPSPGLYIVPYKSSIFIKG